MRGGDRTAGNGGRSAVGFQGGGDGTRFLPLAGIRQLADAREGPLPALAGGQISGRTPESGRRAGGCRKRDGRFAVAVGKVPRFGAHLAGGCGALKLSDPLGSDLERRTVCGGESANRRSPDGAASWGRIWGRGRRPGVARVASYAGQEPDTCPVPAGRWIWIAEGQGYVTAVHVVNRWRVPWPILVGLRSRPHAMTAGCGVDASGRQRVPAECSRELAPLRGNRERSVAW